MKKIILFLQFVIASFICHAQTPNWLWAESNSAGTCWTDTKGLWVGHSGNVYVGGRHEGTLTINGASRTSPSGTEVFSAKMDSSGVFSWIAGHPYSGGNDYDYGFGADKHENTYVTGDIQGSNGLFVDKYNSAGSKIWSFDPPALASGISGYGNIGVDNSGNVYATGSYQGSQNFGPNTLNAVGSNDIFLVKLDSNGNCKWAVSAGASGQIDGGRGVVIDPSGGVYVCGSYNGTTAFNGTTGSPITLPTVSSDGFFIAKYDTAGNPVWVQTASNAGFQNAGYYFWTYFAITVDSCSNVYVTGHFLNTAQFGTTSLNSNGAFDIFVAKCNSNGTWEWAKSAGGTGNDEAWGIILDKHSDVYVSGYFTTSATFDNQTITSPAANAAFVAKYANSNGALQWVQAPSGGATTYAVGLAIDPQGYCYITGSIGSTSTATFGPSTINGLISCAVFFAKLDTVAPRTITPIVSANYCPGETVTLPYTINGTFNSGNTFTAQLSNSSGSFISSTFLGDTLSDDSGTIIITIPDTVTPGSNYLIRVVSDSPSTSSWANGCGAYYVNNVYINDFYVTIGNTLAVAVSPTDSTICSGGSIILGAYGGTGLTYKWTNKGDTTALSDSETLTVNPIDTTTYYVTVSNGTCSGTDSIVINVSPSPPLIIKPIDTVFCSGQSATLFVADGGNNFIWNPGTGIIDSSISGDSVLVNPTLTTTFTVTGTSSGGCASSGIDVVTVIPSPNKPSFTLDGDTLISSSKYDNQWYRNDSLLVNDTSQDLIISDLGEYLVNVTNEANGCSTSSDSMEVDSIAGINQLSEIRNQLSIYPNPFSNEIFIKINSSVENLNDWNLQVKDVLGRTVYSKQSLNYINDIDLSYLSSGVYFITVINNTGRAVYPVVRQN